MQILIKMQTGEI